MRISAGGVGGGGVGGVATMPEIQKFPEPQLPRRSVPLVDPRPSPFNTPTPTPPPATRPGPAGLMCLGMALCKKKKKY